MQPKIYILIFQCLILSHQLRQSNAKALIGHNIRPIRENEFPSVACIIKYNPNSDYVNSMYCTGTFISKTLILTAEHCSENIESMQLEVVVGCHNLANGIRFYPIWWVSYDQWIRMSGRTDSRPLNDILLIKIVGLTHDIIPATTAFMDLNSYVNGLNVQLVGCGVTNTNRMPLVLHTAPVRTVTIHNCVQSITQLCGEAFPLFDHIVCSKGNPYTFLEFGDSGGPLYYQDNIVAINIAVCPKMDVSFHPDKLNIHISLNHYREFLNAFNDDGV